MSKKRRTHSAEFKLATVMEGIQGEKPIAQICRARNITDSLYYKWRDQFQAHAPEIFTCQDKQSQAISELEAQIADLERMVGKLVMENEILKKATH